MIIAGAGLLHRFHWVIYLFGGFILYAGIKMFFSDAAEADPGQSWPVRLARRSLPLHEGYDGGRFFVRKHGKTLATTLFLVLVSIEFTDLVFALDSIPAIFGITRDAFIVFTSNVFAILGLRSMYFLLAGVMGRFHYLKLGLAGVLAFVGIKMLLPGAGQLYGLITGGEYVWHLNKFLALGVIVGLLTASIVASMIWPKPEPASTDAAAAGARPQA
jgi:tellurite resistance protein TerC